MYTTFHFINLIILTKVSFCIVLSYSKCDVIYFSQSTEVSVRDRPFYCWLFITTYHTGWASTAQAGQQWACASTGHNCTGWCIHYTLNWTIITILLIQILYDNSQFPLDPLCSYLLINNLMFRNSYHKLPSAQVQKQLSLVIINYTYVTQCKIYTN